MKSCLFWFLTRNFFSKQNEASFIRDQGCILEDDGSPLKESSRKDAIGSNKKFSFGQFHGNGQQKKIEQYLADDETGGKEEKKTETKMQLEPPKNYDFAAAIKRRRGIILNYEISVTMAKRSLLNVIQKWAKFIKVELPFPGIEGSGKKAT